MKTLALLLLSLPASAQTFPWASLGGEYSFVACDIHERPVWRKNLEEVYVTIYREGANPRENTMHFWLRKKGSPISVGDSYHKIDQGPYEWRNERSGLVEKWETNYTTEDAFLGSGRWDYVAHGSDFRTYGWSTTRFDFEPGTGHLRYDMRVQHQEGEIRHERCTLRRR